MDNELEILEHMIFNVPLDEINIEELRAKFLIYRQSKKNKIHKIINILNWVDKTSGDYDASKLSAIKEVIKE